jgi:uncharacterized protein (TIGR03086 family)
MLDEVNANAAKQSTGCVGLLEEAIHYAVTAVQPITPRLLTRRTPCREWDLMMLLLHLGNSLGALHEGMHLGRVALGGRRHGGSGRPGHAGDESLADPVSAFRVRAVRLLRSCEALRERTRQVAIGAADFSSDMVAGVGAIEVAVHAWDIAQASGAPRPIPASLAAELLQISPMAVPESDRHPLFAEAVEPPPFAHSSDRLVAFLGRRPLLPA